MSSNIEINKIEFLLEKINKQISSFDKKREKNRKYAFLFTLILALISALVTILIGLHGVDEALQTSVQNAALILSALVTVGTVWESFFSPRDLWAKYTQVTNNLREVKSNLEYLKITDFNPDEIDKLHDQYQNVLNNANDQWLKTRYSNNKN